MNCMYRKIVFLIAFVTGFSLVIAQESTVTVNQDGKEFSQLKHTWEANWITHPNKPTFEAGCFLFRKSFQLQKVPKEFVIHVSADNRYKLYVNGTYIVSGPSSGDINHHRYETLNISEYLKQGENVIAAKVVNFGEYKKVATESVQTAFILQNENQDIVNLNTGIDNGWKVLADEGFNVIPFAFSNESVIGYYAAGPGERLVTEKHPWGWKNANFNDAEWSTPRLAIIPWGVGRGFLYGSTWHLVKRTLPFMEEKITRFKKIARSTLPNIPDDFVNGKTSITIPANKTVQILFDEGQHTIGHPILKFSEGKGSEIKIIYAEALYDKDWKKGNRNRIKNKNILGYYDIVLPDGGTNREFQPIGQKTYRFIQLNIQTGDTPLVINDFYGVYTAYPFKEIAKFKTGKEALDKIWDASWLTLRNSAVEGFIDPYYEQLQYIGDTRIESIVSLAVSGDDRLMRKAMEMFDYSRLPNGLTASRYPSYVTQIIPTYSLLWIGMLHDFHLYRNDDAFLKKFIPGMESVLTWWINKIDHTGMPTQMEWWNFTDWAIGYPNGIPPGADDGYSATVALQLVMTLQNAVTLCNDLGYPEKAQYYAKIQQKVQQSVLENCYDTTTKLFAETPKKEQFSQHTNILAVLTNTIPEKEQKDLMERILNNPKLIQTTIYFKYYLFEAMEKVGLGNRYLEQLTPWHNQIKQGLTTFAETDVEPRSDCHAWSSSPNYHFLKIVAGIAPASKNFKTIRIAPNFNGLKNINATMPHPNGIINVNLKRQGTKVRGEVELPKGTNGVFYWKGTTLQLTSGKQKIEVK